MKKKWVIVHFQPLEKYPPAINLIRYAEERNATDVTLHVITTHPGKKEKVTAGSSAKIHYAATWKKRNRFGRLLFYIQFNVIATWLLFRYRPRVILYYETLSAFAPLLYKKWINKKASLYIHYHEYTSPEEYNTGMALNRWLHEKEKRMYLKSRWVSHTNEDRLNMFLKDVSRHRPPHTYILPNYPPELWFSRSCQIERNKSGKIGFVYVGALSMNHMHSVEMARFVAKNPDKCYWDIYSTNHDSEVLAFLNQLGAKNIHFKGAVSYDELPSVLPGYDIGIILYKGDTLNYEFNAPNKFFEYLSCGLNVWFGRGVKGLYAYITDATKPWVRCVNFDELQLPGEDGFRIPLIPIPEFFAEKIYSHAWQAIQADLN